MTGERAPDAVVTARWIGERLGRPDTAVLHVGVSRAEYEAEHLPGAVWVSGPAVFTTERDGIPGLVPAREDLEETLGHLGVDERSTIICVGSGRSPWPYRAYWALRYYGFPRAYVASGSLAALACDGLEVTRSEVQPRPRRCRLREPERGVGATADQVLAAVGGTEAASILDCRTATEFEGRDGGRRAGRVPGALHLDWEQLLDGDGRLLDAARLRAIFEHAGLKPGTPVHAYCGAGVRAAVAWFALHEVLGWPARLFDGSWAEWSRRPDLPVEAGHPAPSPPPR